MMQSSPPQRAANGPPSPATSQYSIDLAALDLDSRSGASTPLPTHHVDQVLSEEIDGPSDFTQNMEAWMRGGTLRKSKMPSFEEKREDKGDEGFLATSANKDAGVLAEEDDVKTASHHTPSNSPPKESVLIHWRDGGEDEEGSSVWEPYAESQTPTLQRMEGKTGLLQPTVEEYFSELTPARAASTEAVKSRTNNGDLEMERSPSKGVLLHPESRALGPTVSSEQSSKFQHPATQSSHSHETALQQELQQLRTQCQHLQNLNTTLNETIDEERHARREATAAYEAQLADVARREQDLTEMKDQSHEHQEDFRQEFSDMKAQIQLYGKQEEVYRSEIDRLHNVYGSEIQKLREQVERERNEHKDGMRILEQDLELARRARDDAEEDARANREELDEQIAEVDRLKMEIQQGEELREGIKEQLRSTKMENERLESSKRGQKEAETALEELGKAKDEEIETLRTEHESVIRRLRKQLEEAKQQLNASEHQRDTHETIETLTKEIDSLRKSHNTTLIERDALQDELFSTRDDLANERTARQAEKEDYEVVNSALHDKISGAIRTREDYWRGRLSEMEIALAELAGVAEEKKVLAEERRVMAKALLRGWGREEMGMGGEEGQGEVGHNMAESGWQLYEYLYAVASESGNAKDQLEMGEKGRKVTFRGRDSFFD